MAKIKEIDWYQLGKDVMTFILNGISNLINNIKELAKTIVSNIKDTIVNTNWLQLGKDIISGIIDGFKKGIGGLLDIAMEACKGVMDAITGFFDIFRHHIRCVMKLVDIYQVVLQLALN